MSTILKALRQSDHRRRHAGPLPAQAPGTHLAPRGRRRRLQWLSAALLLCAGAALGWYLAVPRSQQPAPPRSPRVAQASLPSPRAPDSEAARQAPASGTAGSGQPGEPPGHEAGTGEREAAGDDLPAESAQPKSAQTAGAAAPGTPTAGGSRVASGAETPTSPEPGGGADTEVAEAPEPILDKHALLPRWRDLPESRRQALSPLVLNAHIYAPDAASRFVLINLSRYGEGDRVRDGLKVVEIFPGGVVMDDGQGEFVIPRP